MATLEQQVEDVRSNEAASAYIATIRNGRLRRSYRGNVPVSRTLVIVALWIF